MTAVAGTPAAGWALDAHRLTDPAVPTADLLAAAGGPVDLASLRDLPDGPVAEADRRLVTRPVGAEPTAWSAPAESLLIVVDGRAELIRSGAARLVGEGQSVRVPAGEPVAVRGTASCPKGTLLLVHAATGPVTDRPEVAADAAGVPHARDFYYGYADRYAAVYAAGGVTWEAPEPNDVLIANLDRLPGPPARIVDLGCGEGRDSVYLATQGYRVTGVDVARAALDKGRGRAAAAGADVEFLERDVVQLDGLPAGAFDLALNMGCLHMIPDDDLRAAHLRAVHGLLRPGGLFLLAHCREKWLQGFYSVPDYDTVGPVVPGRVVPRRIRMEGGATGMIDLPLVPYREAGTAELTAELAAAGLVVEEDLSADTEAFGNTVVLLARRP